MMGETKIRLTQDDIERAVREYLERNEVKLLTKTKLKFDWIHNPPNDVRVVISYSPFDTVEGQR